MLGFRIIFTACCVVAGYHFRPFSLSKELGAIAGFLFAVGVILFEVRLRRASLRRLIGAVVGSILGILGAYLTFTDSFPHHHAGKHSFFFQPG